MIVCCRIQTVVLMSDSVCSYFSFLSLLSVYLKSSQIVSAGSPEVKPAKAHTSYSVCYVLRSSCDLWPHVIPSFSFIFPVIVTSRVSFPMESMLCHPLLLIYSMCLLDAVLTLKAQPWEEQSF